MRLAWMARVAFAALITVCTVISFAMGGGFLARLVALQLGPSFLVLAAGQITVGAVVAAGIFAATALFGRFYCSLLCPLGFFQECIGYLHKRQTKASNLKWTRYLIAALSFGLLAGGWAVGFKLFEPVTRSGSMISTAFVLMPEYLTGGSGSSLPGWPIIVAGIATFSALIMLVAWKNRLYCTALCPIGTVLGLVGKFSFFRIRFTEKCAGCGKCAVACPTGCIDLEARQVDSERCVVCLDCLTACRIKGISYSRKSRVFSNAAASSSPSRRAFLGKSVIVAAGALVAGYGAKEMVRSIAAAGERLAERVLPPGAGDPDSFYRRCTGCQLCVASCPTGIIKPSMLGFGPVYLDYTNGCCDYDCTVCGSVCPTGALERLSLNNKRYTRIGTGEVRLDVCRVIANGEPCDLCSKACPAGAIYMGEGSTGLLVPEVNSYHCIGCGACLAACSARPKAITVKAIGVQQLA